MEVFAAAAAANPTFYADLTNPQSLNKYQYALNNPLRYVDPDGHDPQDPVKEPTVDPVIQILTTFGVGTLICGPACGVIAVLIDPPPAGEPNLPHNTGPPKASEFFKQQGQDLAMGLIIPGGSKLRELGQVEKGVIKTAKNILAEQVDTKTLQAAAREAAGEVVATKGTGQAFDHITKVKNGLQGLKSADRQISRSLRDTNLSSQARATLQRNLKQVRTAIQRTKRYINDNNIQ